MNKPPIAVVEISKLTIMLGETIAFDASESYDIDGDVEFYYWNFDDGYTSSQATADHEYKNSGTYNVSLKIIDDLNDITTVYYTIEVINRLPIVNFQYFTPGTGTTLATFEFTDLSFDHDGDIEQWNWDFGDGGTSDLQNPDYQFDLPGTYDVTLSVTDDQDGTNSTTLAIEVQNAPPIPKIRIKDGINLGNHQWSIPANRMIEIDGSVTFDNEGDALEFFWDIDGQSLSGESIEIDFMEQRILELRVVDSRGGEAVNNFTIIPSFVATITIENWEDYTEIALGYDIILQTTAEGGELDLYKWYTQERNLDTDYLLIDDINTNDSFQFPAFPEGEYLVKVSGRHTETKLWTENFSFTTFVYNNPYA